MDRRSRADSLFAAAASDPAAAEAAAHGLIAEASAAGDHASAALAGRLPGPGSVYLGQNLRFKAPVRPGDTVHATVTVKELIHEKRRVALSTVCTVDGKAVIEGEALVMPTSRTARAG